MDAWKLYHDIRLAHGVDKRASQSIQLKESVTRRLMDSPASKVVLINGEEQIVSIAHTEAMDTKKIFALPDERLYHGGIVDFADYKWLITEIDADNEIYEKGLMTQCNHVLRWIDESGEIKEKWCIVEDGTKYLIGEKRTHDYSIGEARISITIGKDEDTIKLSRGRRFLIDDEEADMPTAYEITKINRLFSNYNGCGVFRFILTETPIQDADHIKLMIADYANWEPKKELDGEHRDSERNLEDIVADAIERDIIPERPNKEVWL